MNEKRFDNCGTVGGSQKHRRAKETPCDDCRKAFNENNKKWRESNPDKVKATQKKWAESNPEKVAQNRKNWASKNKDHYVIKKRNRRAKIKNLSFEKYTILDVIDKYGTDCHLCNKSIDMLAPRMSGKLGWQNGFQIDHLIPISKGGNDTLINVRPSHGICNIKKGANK